MQVLTSIPGKDLKVCLARVGKNGERSSGSGNGSWQ